MTRDLDCLAGGERTVTITVRKNLMMGRGAAPEGVEVVELYPLHKVKRALKLLFCFSWEANDHVPCNGGIGHHLTYKQNKGYVRAN